ncbi:hypothetical protein AA0472_2699 [Acetobacter estunensis NRIC 0472]|nr:hypothetical protein AA0472_2699 [Acetobacter estunensis NRIC 0472]
MVLVVMLAGLVVLTTVTVATIAFTVLTIATITVTTITIAVLATLHATIALRTVVALRAATIVELTRTVLIIVLSVRCERSCETKSRNEQKSLFHLPSPSGG